MSSSRSTEQRSHCSRVNARCMIFLTIFSRSVCSSNRSLTTSNSAYVTTIEPYRNVGYSLTLVFLKTCRSSLLPDSSHTLCETLKTTWHWKLICHRKVDTSAAPEQKSKKEKKKNQLRQICRAEESGLKMCLKRLNALIMLFQREPPSMKTESIGLKCRIVPKSIKGFVYFQQLHASKTDAAFLELYLEFCS